MKSDFHFAHPLRVRWSEVDRQGVVFFGNYLNYYDIAMTEYMRAIGFPYPRGLLDRGTDLHVIRAEAEYKGSARFDDVIEIHTKVERLGQSSLTFAFEVYREGEDELLSTGRTVYVNVDQTSRKSSPLPAELTEKVRRREGVENIEVIA
jgi:acyl-CoA thioester hydrolase